MADPKWVESLVVEMVEHQRLMEERMGQVVAGLGHLRYVLESIERKLGAPQPAAKRTITYPRAFGFFWSAYPKHRRKSKPETFAVWQELGINEAVAPHVMGALASDKASFAWTKEGGKYIPNAAKWLRAERWVHGTADGEDPNPTLEQIRRDSAGFDAAYGDV